MLVKQVLFALAAMLVMQVILVFRFFVFWF